MATAPANLRTLYRSLLRELPPRPYLTVPRPPLHQRLRDTFAGPRAQPDARTQAAQGEQYLAYLRAQRDYVRLIERYNPGMGMDEQRRVRLTAKRVGMDLPAEYDGGEGGGKEE
ncbi:FMC1 protein family [Trichocladium antarcticum]|uniref:FMC1 protein family n=1 Tax=Trichocladium antarcticum TaxID=1450529 RepID=A0AAN6UL46_9PEZI|nr:FMC1 protein family [Trichocladium antarcticum]